MTGLSYRVTRGHGAVQTDGSTRRAGGLGPKRRHGKKGPCKFFKSKNFDNKNHIGLLCGRHRGIRARVQGPTHGSASKEMVQGMQYYKAKDFNVGRNHINLYKAPLR